MLSTRLHALVQTIATMTALACVGGAGPVPSTPDTHVDAAHASDPTPSGEAAVVPASRERRRPYRDQARLLEAVVLDRSGRVSRVPITTDDFDRLAPDNRGHLPAHPGSLPHPVAADGEEDVEEADPSDQISESVIGSDDRRPVTSTTSYPFRTIGRMEHGCTGTLIGPRHVLTAGHCVYDRYTNDWKDGLGFSPGQNGEAKPLGSYEWTHVITVEGWFGERLSYYDLALVVLEEDVGSKLGWLGIQYDDASIRYLVNLAGYPVDKEEGTAWHSACTIDLAQSFRLHYECDTSNGNSGSGVYVYHRTANRREIVGVHAYGIGAETGLNSATRIRRATFAAIQKWLDEF